MVRSKIKEISNIHFDMFDLIVNKDKTKDEYTNLHEWKKANRVENLSFGEIVAKLENYLEYYNFKLIHPFIILDVEPSLISSDVIGKFFIIKNEDNFLETKTNRPLRLYTEKEMIGKIIGAKGKNVKHMANKLNAFNKFWNVPYISINDIEERTTNNNQKELNKKFLELLDIIF